METVIRIAGLCLAAALTASLLRQHAAPEFGLLLTAAAARLGAVLLLDALREAAALGDELIALTGLAPSLFLPLVKVTAIGVVTRVAAALCVDAGQSALARVMESAGAVCALGCALPLLRAVTDLIRGWL